MPTIFAPIRFDVLKRHVPRMEKPSILANTGDERAHMLFACELRVDHGEVGLRVTLQNGSEPLVSFSWIIHDEHARSSAVTSASGDFRIYSQDSDW